MSGAIHASLVLELDAMVLGPAAGTPRVCGLTLAERARRVASKAGATRVAVNEVPDGDGPLLVIDAAEHVVHTGLVTPLQLASGESRIAVDERGQFAGALVASRTQRAELAAAAAKGSAALAELAASWRAAGTPTETHGKVARHVARTSAERRAAYRFLYKGVVDKPQDTFLVRYVNRRVSYPFTKLMLPTPITPNMISVAVFLMGAFGCVWLTQPGYWPPVIGTLILLFAGYIDGCDGEIARLRHETSKLGAWLDTMADEATTVLFVTCVGIHVYNTHHVPWLAWIVAIAAVQAVTAVYCIYYYLLSTGGSGNSQDYPTKGGVLDFLRLFIRREMINLGSMLLAVSGQVELLYALLVLGGLVSCAVLVPQHVQLRRAKSRATPARG